MRIFIGGVIGAAIAVAAWLALEHFTHSNFGWLACFVGLATGLGVSRSDKPNASGKVARGIMAIVITLAAILGGRQTYAKLIQSATPTGPRAIATARQEAEDNDDDEKAEEDSTVGKKTEKAETADSADSAPTLLQEVTERSGPGGIEHTGRKSVPVKNYSTQLDTLWMCLAALSAYFMGKKSSVAILDSEPSETS